MARKKSEKRVRAYEIWVEHRGNIAMKEIAAMIVVPEATVRSWARRDKWTLPAADCNATKNCNAKNSVANVANPAEAATPSEVITPRGMGGNSNALVDGARAHPRYKYLSPDEKAAFDAAEAEPQSLGKTSAGELAVNVLRLNKRYSEGKLKDTDRTLLSLIALHLKGIHEATLMQRQQPAPATSTVVNVNGGGLDLKSLNLRSLSDEDLDRLGELVDKMGASSHADA